MLSEISRETTIISLLHLLVLDPDALRNLCLRDLFVNNHIPITKTTSKSFVVYFIAFVPYPNRPKAIYLTKQKDLHKNYEIIGCLKSLQNMLTRFFIASV